MCSVNFPKDHKRCGKFKRTLEKTMDHESIMSKAALNDFLHKQFSRLSEVLTLAIQEKQIVFFGKGSKATSNWKEALQLPNLVSTAYESCSVNSSLQCIHQAGINKEVTGTIGTWYIDVSASMRYMV